IRGPGVFDVTISVEIAVSVHPFERQIDVVTQFIEETQITGPGCMPADEDEEEWCSINRTVIGRVRDFAEAGHFAHTDFVQDLSRLFFAPLVDLLPLQAGE